MRKAILCAIQLNTMDDALFKENIEECIGLCEACDIEIADVATQKSNAMDIKTAFRSGKLIEVKNMLIASNLHLAVFYNNLSNAMVANLEEELNVEVLDRTTLILDIFMLRSKTREAKVQTELAKLRHELTKHVDLENDKQKGGSFKNKGSGEKENQLVRRKSVMRIAQLKKELEDIEKSRDIQYAKNRDSSLKRVVLVGYTNAGKSSLMNAILRKTRSMDNKMVMEKDMLFATLDTSCRLIRTRTMEFLLMDTVGFVSDLPHELIEAFKSTLRVCREADLIIHVKDASTINYEHQSEVTLETLGEIGADAIPRIEVSNKCDLCKSCDGLMVSASKDINIDLLINKIQNELHKHSKEMTVFIPYEMNTIIYKDPSRYEITKLTENNDGTYYHIRSEYDMTEFKKFEKEVENEDSMGYMQQK